MAFVTLFSILISVLYLFSVTKNNFLQILFSLITNYYLSNIEVLIGSESFGLKCILVSLIGVLLQVNFLFSYLAALLAYSAQLKPKNFDFLLFVLFFVVFSSELSLKSLFVCLISFIPVKVNLFFKGKMHLYYKKEISGLRETRYPPEELIAQLTLLGFDREQSIYALQITGNSVERSINLLLND